MRKIFWRVLVYFSVVLIAFISLISLLFSRLSRTNITGTYKSQLTNLATSVATRTERAQRTDNSSDFTNYLQAIEDFGNLQKIDIWIASNTGQPEDVRLSSRYTNVDLAQMTFSPEMRRIIDLSMSGKKANYTNEDKIYNEEMMHIAVPIKDTSGNVIGAVIVSGPMKVQNTMMSKSRKYLIVCISLGFAVAIMLSIVFSRQIVRPILRLNQFAKIIASGDYMETTGITRHDELGSLADSMDELVEKLDEAERYREEVEQSRIDFFSNISHELRTPITVTRGYADTLVEGYVNNPAKRNEYLKRIQEECIGMERLVSDLLIMSRMQNPDFQLDMEVINLIAVAQDAMRSLRILMGEKQLRGEVTYEDERSLIEGDYDRIRQVFVVLLQNAIKYCDVGTEIVVHIAKEDGRLVTTVTDFGVVIPEEEWDQVFEKFYRASTHGKREGSGIGLVVAKHIIERHGGEISVTSDKENGTVFRIVLDETDAEF